MKFIREYFDEKDDKYVLEYHASEDEMEKINTYCKNNNITIDEMVEQFLQKCIDNSDEFKEFVKKMQLPVGKPGKPVLKVDDAVGFYMNFNGDEKFYTGKVAIVDSYGTFEQNEEPSYDIFVEDFNSDGGALVKHIRESRCYKI